MSVNNHLSEPILSKASSIELTAHLASVWEAIPVDTFCHTAAIAQLLRRLGRPVTNNLSATLYELRQRDAVDCKYAYYGSAKRWVYRRPKGLAITIARGHPKAIRYEGMASNRGKNKSDIVNAGIPFDANDAGYANRLVKPKVTGTEEPCNTAEQQEMDIPKPVINPKLTELSQQIAASLTQMMDGAAGVESAVSELVRATQQFPSFMEMRAENERLKYEIEQLQDKLNTTFPGEDGLLVERVTAEVMAALKGKVNG